MYVKNSLKGRSIALIGLVVLVAGLVLSGCSNTQKDEAGQDEKKKIAKLVYVNWAEGVAYTHLAEVILEEKMGYEVEITAADVAPAYAAVAQGDQDAFMESWLPYLQKQYIKKFGSDLVDLGHVYKNTRMGLVVPEYVDINTISELNEHSEKFGGKITGIDAGAGIMVTTDEELIPAYDMDLELMASSGPAMTAALKESIDKQEWIVVTGWTPHWIFGRWDLKFLEQDQEEVWGTGNIHIFGRKNLKEEKPELAEFLSNMQFSQAQLADLMLKVRESDASITTVVRTWLQAHPDLIDSWIPEAD